MATSPNYSGSDTFIGGERGGNLRNFTGKTTTKIRIAEIIMLLSPI